MSNADLRGTDLRGTYLAGADLTNANLRGAHLGGDLWNNTICPDGTNSDANGGTCVGHLTP